MLKWFAMLDIICVLEIIGAPDEFTFHLAQILRMNAGMIAQPTVLKAKNSLKRPRKQLWMMRCNPISILGPGGIEEGKIRFCRK